MANIITKFELFENNISDDFTNEGIKNIIAAGMLFLASCTYVHIEHNGEKIDNKEYGGLDITGEITQERYISRGDHMCEITDNKGNKIYLRISPTDFWCRDEASIGDSVILNFDDDGKECMIYKKDKFTPNSFHKVRGGGFNK
jgi:hypothetical protein